ncbi:PA3715 family protein [Stenotrophomonas lactitubi]
MPTPLRLRRLLGAALLAALPATALACDDAEAMREAAYRQLPAGALPVTARFTDADSSACRAWPAQPGTTLLAVAQWTEPASEDVRGGDLDLLLIDTASGRPLAWTRVADAVSSDALRFSGLHLDTARWQLDPVTRAFGVRMDYSGSSGPNPFAQTELQLFVRDGRRLRRVLAPLAVSGSRGEWDTRCAGEFSRFERTLEMGSSNSPGLAPIVVREKRIDTVSVGVGDDCHATDTTAPAQRWTLLPSDGRYAVPEALRGL